MGTTGGMQKLHYNTRPERVSLRLFTVRNRSEIVVAAALSGESEFKEYLLQF